MFSQKCYVDNSGKCKKLFNVIDLHNVSHCLQKCLTFMDRGYVFKLINSYMDKFNPGDPKTLYDYKFVFLQIICSHEHYIAFNLPLLYPRLGTTSRTGELLYEALLCHKNIPTFLNHEDCSLVGCNGMCHQASHPRRTDSSATPLWELHISHSKSPANIFTVPICLVWYFLK